MPAPLSKPIRSTPADARQGAGGHDIKQALAGIVVVDFGQYIAGPMAAMLLADQGAQVIRIDPPDGPRFPTPANATWQRGKHSVVLDLKLERDRASAQKLIESADVLIENFRPGCMDRLGLGSGPLMASNPGLIYCSLPGFAADDPRATVPAWEGVVAAATDTYRKGVGAADDQPVYLGLPVASNFAAFLAATSICAALIARARDGLGQRIEVPLFDAMFTAIGARGMRVPVSTDPVLDSTGFGIYECAQGRCVHFAPVAPRFMEWFVDAVGVPAWREEGLLDRPRLATEPALLATLRGRLRELFKARTALEWEAFGDANGIPLAMCRTMAEWVDTPHALASGAIVELDDPEYGRMRVPGLAVRMSETPGRIRGPRAQLDADRSVLDSLGPRPAAAPCLLGAAAPALAGVRVLDLTQVWAGPTAARTLAEFGADVIKINSPHEAIITHLDVNRGKRTLLLDLSSAEGLELFWRLVEGADVVLQNFRLGVAQRLGIGYEQVRQRRPDIIYASVSAYGYQGPWGERRGYEVQGQAVVGAQVQFGGDGPAMRLPYEINDYGTGVLGAYAILLALFHRRRTGVGQQVEAALAYTATLHQSLHLQSFAGNPWDEPRGQRTLGTGPLQRLYRASDGWFFLGARERDLALLARIGGLEGIAALRDAALARFLERSLALAPVAQWLDRLTSAGLGAQALATVSELMADPWVKAHGLSMTREHEGVGSVTMIGPVPRLSRTPLIPGRPAAPPGSDLPEVLREFEKASGISNKVPYVA